MKLPMAEQPVISGQIPRLADSYVPRYETGLSPAALPPGTTAVLVPAVGTAGSVLGGTGKTQLAAALAHALCREHAAGLILWIVAASRDAVVSGYAHASSDVGVATPGASPDLAAAQFLAWLSRTRRPWVVVLDDLADGAVIDGLWPQGPAGWVLVTAEWPDAAATASNPRVVPVGPFSPREALTYLSGQLQVDTSQRMGGLDLARDVGFLPLALAQAVGAMTVLGISCTEYRSRLAEHKARLASPGADALSAAWLLSAEATGLLPSGEFARRALALGSMLGPHGIPGAVLTSDAACDYLTGRSVGFSAQRARARAALTSLAETGLMSIDPSSEVGTVLVHAAVQAITRQHLSATESRQAALAAETALIQAWSQPAVPSAVDQRLRDCTASLQEMAGGLLWAPGCHPVLLQAGRSLASSGLAASAADYWQTMLATSRQALGTRHAHTIVIRDQFGAACEASGRWQEAIAVYEQALTEQALTEQEQALSVSHPDVAVARARLARAYSAAGRHDDAIRLAHEAVADVEKVPGSGPDSLSAHECLARVSLSAGQFDEAVDAFRKVLAGREQLQGSDHPQTIAACGELATACRVSGKIKEAIILCRRALADSEWVQGPHHLDTITARAGLAAAYHAARQPRKALPLYERTLADRERVQGADHGDAIIARGDLAAAQLSVGRLAHAVSQYEQTLAACKRVYGPDHRVTRTARDDLNTAAAHARAKLGIDLRSTGP